MGCQGGEGVELRLARVHLYHIHGRGDYPYYFFGGGDQGDIREKPAYPFHDEKGIKSLLFG